jgi:D-alanyl-D-alanine carboxypeptidase
MKRTVSIVFSGLFACTAALTAHAQSPLALDASKLKLASANVLVLDAASNRPIYAKSADEVTRSPRH